MRNFNNKDNNNNDLRFRIEILYQNYILYLSLSMFSAHVLDKMDQELCQLIIYQISIIH